MLANAASTIHLEAMPIPSTIPSATSDSIDPRRVRLWMWTRKRKYASRMKKIGKMSIIPIRDWTKNMPSKQTKRRRRDREQPVRPQTAREEIHHRDAQDSEDAGGDPPPERVEPKVDVVALGALEVRPVPAVAPLAGRDEHLGQRRLRVEVVEAAVSRRRPAQLDALDVVVGVDRKVDLVEDLAVGRRQVAVLVRVAAIERDRRGRRASRDRPWRRSACSKRSSVTNGP